MKQISQHIATLFILLNIIIFPVSAIENYNPFSNNTINHDTDKDGMWDEEEELFGTDPNDADDNYESLRARNQISTSCFDITPIFNGILSESEKEKLIRQLESYSVQDINTLADYNQQKIDALLESASISAEQIEYGGEGLTTLIKNAEEIDFVQNGVSGVFIITGKYGRTSFSPLIASCTGTIIGILYGSGMGVKDDASFTYSLIKGIWHYATHIREISNVWGAVVNFVKSINWGTIDSMFRSVSLDIVKRGKDVIDFFDLKPTSAEYASYQMGFYGGYIAGYIAEQVAFLKGIGEAFKSLKVGAKLGHTVSRATEILARITNKFGGHVADSLRGLRIWQKAVKWGDDVIDGMAYLIKRTTKGTADDILEKMMKESGESVTKRSFKVVSNNLDELNKLNVDEFGKFVNDLDAWSGTLKVAELEEPLTVWRVYGGGTPLEGGWLTEINPSDWPIAKRKQLLALPPENSAMYATEIELPKGIKIIFGDVAPRYGQPGGGKQIRLLSNINFGG